MHKPVHVLIVALVAALSIVSTAAAIVGGRVDGNAHPYVGALVVDDEIVCSGVLVGPALFATAAHCVEGLAEGAQVAVSFDASLDRAAWTVHVGTAHADPAYTGKTKSDLAVVVFDAPLTERAASLPARGSLDRLARGTSVTSVGYGYSAVSGRKDFVYDGLRHAGESPVKDVSSQVVTLSTKQAGPCLGDSGGPQLLGDVVVSITSSGSNDCSGRAESYRLDTARARGFLGQFVTLP